MIPECVEVETGAAPTGSVIWLHGLGADGHDFAPIVPALVERGDRPLRFVFPHAPRRPVTLNGGMVMRGWYDIAGIDRHVQQDEAGIRASYDMITALIRKENERGISTQRIVLGGFSQGGSMSVYALARYPETLAGVAALSCYMLLHERFEAERVPANQRTPLFMAHGKQDPLIAYELGVETRQLLEKSGYTVQWHDYPMPHSVCPEEVADLAAWLRQVLP